MRKLINVLINKTGRSGYEVDPLLHNNQIFVILLQRFFDLVRGLKFKLLFLRSEGLLFAGKV